MNAREELIEALLPEHPLLRGRNEEHQANLLVDNFAHELAEKIRNSEWLQDWTDGHMGDCYLAADLIDPGVK